MEHLHYGSHGVEHDQPPVLLRHVVDRVHDRGDIDPCHHEHADDLLHVPEVYRGRRQRQGDAQCQQVLQEHHQGEVEHRLPAEPEAGHQHGQEDDGEAEEHVHEGAGHVGDGDYLPGEGDLLDHLGLGADAGRAPLDAGVEEGPGHHADNQIEVELLYLDPEYHGEHRGVDHHLAQGVDVSPEEAEHRALVAPPELPPDQAPHHVPVCI